ncbi:MAG: PepSY protein [Bacteroidetes bacterium]|nr:PepSY protein [Bacteroidota bacterium]
MFKRILYSFHRILGTILSILFLMWFLSGFVMMYHAFPKLTERDRNAHAQALNMQDCQQADSIIASGLSKPKLNSLELNLHYGHAQITSRSSDSEQQMVCRNGIWDSVRKPTFAQIRQYAGAWNSAPIIRTDTLHDLEQWIPFGKLRADLPIYKFYFGDKLHHQLYVSSATGEALQLTTQDSRFWAWLGPIPHWIYFTKLRQDVSLWKNMVITISGIGCVMCLAGIVIGIRSFLISRRKRGTWATPYRRFAYKWHHLTGFFFGFFVFTFIFSGMMSLADVPTSIVKIHNPKLQEQANSEASITGIEFKADYKQLLADYPKQVTQIKWMSVGKTPVLQAVVSGSTLMFDASRNILKPLHMSPAMIKELVQTGTNSCQIDTLYNYDNYYGSPGKQLPLPVYKVSVKDGDQSVYYVEPATGKLIYYNSNAKVAHWSYQILHRFALGVLVQHNTLRLCLLWFALLGGTLVSITGVWLSVRYLQRKLIRKKHNS